MARHIMLNGTIMPSDTPCLSYDNRGLLWGDSFTVKLRGNSCIVYDFRSNFQCICKMAESMGMEAPDSFKPKIFANDLLLLLRKNRIYKEFAATLTIFRNSSGTTKSLVRTHFQHLFRLKICRMSSTASTRTVFLPTFSIRQK